MRPLELTLHGFRSYRDATTFEWRDRSLVGIVGPIGSGKSTILDAVAFALFGKTPTFERDTKSLIHQLAETCHVELRFEVDGQVWRAVRALRRKGASGHQLERLASDAPDAEAIEHITGERAIRQRVEELLGMDFDAFCRSVLLAQNRFSEFLMATPAERNEVLKGVFGYERFDAAHDEAKRRVAAADAVLDELARSHEAAERARVELVEARAILDAAAATADRLREARPAIEALTGEIGVAEERGTRAEERLAKLDAVARTLPGAEPLEATLGAAERTDGAIAAASQAAEEAERARKEAEATALAVAERVGDRSAFVALVQQHDHAAEAARLAHERAERLSGLAAEARTLVAEAAEGAGAAAEERAVAARALASAATDVARAETALHEARHADMARTLRVHLVTGARCPVCDQPVATLPKAARSAKIDAVEAALARARAAEVSSREANERAAEAMAAAQERAAALRTQADRADAESAETVEAARAAEAELAAIASQLVDRLGEGDPHALLDEREAELRAAEAARVRATEAAAEAREALERTRNEGAAAREALTRLAMELASAWGQLGEPREIGGSPDELRAAFVALGERLLEQHEATRTAAAEAGEARRAAAEALRGVHDELGLPPGTDFADALADAATAHAAARQRVEGLQAAVGAAAELEARTEAVRRGRDLAKRLASDLQPSRFLAFLLEEERAALGELGSTHFEELTNGAYRFTDDDRFDVVDMNAGASDRRADSLSGGETFLASLALALALAEMVARGGGRLDAFFLDEGFGSLDPEHLERAMDGIGRLVAGDARRLVVLVSHVDQMRQMLEDLIVLDKDALTGDTIVVSGARPA